MTPEFLPALKTFSPNHRRFITLGLKEILSHYGGNLLAVAIFGSYARGENRNNSDLDLLIILDRALRMRMRIVDFVEHIEMKQDSAAQSLFEEEEISVDLSPYILTRKEALSVQPIYFDLVFHHLAVYDPVGLLSRIVSSMRQIMERGGFRKVRQNNSWEWQTGRFLGGIRL